MQNLFQKRLREERVKKGLTQAQLGSIVGLSNTAISSYESGRKIPSIVTFINLANYFKISIDYLVGLSNSNAYMVEDSDIQLIHFLRDNPNIFEAVIPSKHRMKSK